MIDRLYIGYDSAGHGEERALSICRRTVRGLKILKTFTGEEAKKIYEKLTTQEDEKR